MSAPTGSPTQRVTTRAALHTLQAGIWVVRLEDFEVALSRRGVPAMAARRFVASSSMVSNLQDLEIPDDETTASAADAVARLSTHMRQHPTPSGRVVLCVADAPDTNVNVPATVFKLFIDVLDELAKGNAVQLPPFTLN